MRFLLSCSVKFACISCGQCQSPGVLPTCPTPVCKIWSPVCASSSDFTSPAGRTLVRLSPASCGLHPMSCYARWQVGPRWHVGWRYLKGASAPGLDIRTWSRVKPGLEVGGWYLPACWVTSAKDRFCSLCRMRKVRAGPTTLPSRCCVTASPTLDPRL